MSSKKFEGELWQRLVEEGASESALWAELLLPEPERSEQLSFSPLATPELALGIETIYEGYLVHYGRSRLFSQTDPNLALLLGDRLYARGLVHVSESGSVAVVADLATLLELCARLQAERQSGRRRPLGRRGCAARRGRSERCGKRAPPFRRAGTAPAHGP